MTDGEAHGSKRVAVTLGAALRGIGLGALVRRERRVFLLALACAVIGPVAAMTMPFSAKLVIDEVIGRGRGELVFPITLAAALGLVIQSGVAYGAAQFGTLGGQRVVTRLRQTLQQHIMRLPARFFDSQQSGALVSRIITDTDQIHGLLASGMLQLVSGLLSGALAFAVLWYVNWQLTAVVTGLLLLVGIGLTQGFRRLHPAFHTAAELQAALAGRLTQVLGGILVVKTCAAERREAHRFAQDSHRLMRAYVHASRVVSALIATIALTIGGVSLVLLVLGGQAVAAGVMTLGDLALFVILVGLLGSPMVQAAAIGSDLGRGLAAVARIAEILGLPTERGRGARPMCAPSHAADVVFDDVSYAYEPGHPVLCGVSFSALPGSITALTGPNGAGKSTLLALLMRLDSPSSGRILLGGLPLGHLRLADYRRSLGVVLQQNQLFDGTVAENIRYGRPAASPAEFRRAARLAHCDEFVEALTRGYETLVGERGVKLSGGQRQRVAIARAILADPRILLLDEAGSHLDSESERLLEQALLALCSGRTTFVVTHRLKTVRRADQILVLRKGAIVQRGTFQELRSVCASTHSHTS